MTAAMAAMYEQLREVDQPELKDVTIDTGANRKSVICQSQYTAYEKEFGRRIPVKKSKRKGVKGIGGLCEILGDVSIQIPFKELGLIIDVDFALMK